MWETYPDEELQKREGMLKHTISSGNYDNEKLEREKIRAEIRESFSKI
jgi:hypothetical protein